jgi:omega-6 fatty acid desaturase (delta-12 desaturase)
MHPRQHADAALALVVHAALVAAFAVFAPAVLLWSLVVPLGLATALGSYLFYAQHNFPGAHFQHEGARDHAVAALVRSSFIPMHAVLRWFTGNIGYHHVHHLNARIPFYRLPEAMSALKGVAVTGGDDPEPARRLSLSAAQALGPGPPVHGGLRRALTATTLACVGICG